MSEGVDQDVASSAGPHVESLLDGERALVLGIGNIDTAIADVGPGPTAATRQPVSAMRRFRKVFGMISPYDPPLRT
jgi:hypothetical protein